MSYRLFFICFLIAVSHREAGAQDNETVACSTKKSVKPYCSLDEVVFKEYPCLVKIQDEYHLRYQLDTSVKSQKYTRFAVGHYTADGKAYYYFVGKTSYKEYGMRVERNINKDGYREAALKNEVYWINRRNECVRLALNKE